MKVTHFSRIGFILAAAGSAVGLGNIWKFPYITGEYGGGAFVLVYLLTVVGVGFTVMVAEMLIGYLGRTHCVGNFETLAPKNKKFWSLTGWMQATSIMVMIYYSVVIGWIFYYIAVALSGTMPSSIDGARETFTTLLTKSFWTQLFFHTIAFVITTAVIVRGIKGGIEKFNIILMPSLMLILGGMFFYALDLSGFAKAFSYMFNPDWSKLSSEAFAIAVGQAFFSLSLGYGAIMIYSSSLPKNGNIVKSSLFIIVIDTLIAIVAGLILFTFLFEYGAEPANGPGLVFISLPAVFYEMGVVGNVLAVLFFIALAMAGLTSAVSLVEPMVNYIMDKFKFSRFKAAISVGMFYYLFGVVAILSQIEWSREYLTWGGKNFFDWADYTTSAVLLPIAGFMMVLFVGFVLEKERVASILKPQLGHFYKLWYFSLRYVAPLALLLVLLNVSGIIQF